MLVCAGWVGFSLLGPQAWAAAVPAPSKVLQHPRNQVVVGSYLGRLDDGRYRFAKVEELRGKDSAPDELVLRGPEWLAGLLARNEHYLFAYSSYVPNPRFARDYLIDTEGPRLVNALGLEPAIFRDAAELHDTLLHPLDDVSTHSDAFAAQVVAGLGSRDTQIQNYYAAEVTQRRELSKRTDAAMVDAIKLLLRNPDGHPSARAGLLRMAANRHESYDKAFLTDVVSQVLAQAPLSGYQDPRPQPGELVRVALQLAAEQSLAVAPTAIDRLALCDSTALSEAALLTIRQLDPARERSVATDALKQTQLPAATREFLLDHLRRLDLANGSKK